MCSWKILTVFFIFFCILIIVLLILLIFFEMVILCTRSLILWVTAYYSQNVLVSFDSQDEQELFP